MTIPRILLTLAVAAPLAAQTFIQMSDPQFGMYSKDHDFVQETANYEFAVAASNRLKPRFVIICGDLVNKAGEQSQIEEYLRITGKFDRAIRVYPVSGNHDVGNLGAGRQIAERDDPRLQRQDRLQARDPAVQRV